MVYWKINQAEITELFCENKDEPILKCNGKCHLLKNLVISETTDESKQNSSDLEKVLKVKELEAIIHTLILECLFQDFSREKISTSITYLLKGFCNRLFQPPIYS